MAAAAASATEEEGLPIISEKQSTTTTTTKPEKESPAVDICVALVLILSIVGAVYVSIGVVHLLGGHWQKWFSPYDPVEYTVTIAAFSGLDPAKDLRHGPPPPAPPAQALVYPAFNLTLHVASPRAARRRECLQAGTTVEVSYLRPSGSGRVPLASGTSPAFCVEVGERRDEGSVIAWSDGVRLPGLVLDSLAADMLRGAAEFVVKLTPPPYCGSGGARLFCSDTVEAISCWAKVGGGPAAPCSVSKERVLFPPVPRPGVRDPARNLPQPTP